MPNDLLQYIDQHIDTSVARLMQFVRIPSVSTDPAYAPDCRKAAGWLVDTLCEIGFNAASHETAGHPIVVGHSGAGPNRLLFYGHYDVQPVDPLALWDLPPFEPAIIDATYGKALHGRGASDDKGQLMTFLEACRAWKEVRGSLPQGLAVILEGEEECASVSLAPFLEQHGSALKADLALICDTGLFNSESPAIVSSLRGMLAEEIEITGPNIDLHSGMYGGLAVNPLRVLSGILAGLHDSDNRVQVPEFYRDVRARDHERLAMWDGLGFDAGEFLGQVGVQVPNNESGYTPLEALWTRPTCEINGITGGYGGDGFKTVLPSRASAKISFRLVADQDPAHIQEKFHAHVRSMVPADCRVRFNEFGGEGASNMSTDSPLFGEARQALADEWGREAVLIGCGGSIPVASMFKEKLGMNALLTGFGRDDDAIHSPNERYSLENFHKGTRSWARILDRAEGLQSL